MHAVSSNIDATYGKYGVNNLYGANNDLLEIRIPDRLHEAKHLTATLHLPTSCKKYTSIYKNYIKIYKTYSVCLLITA